MQTENASATILFLDALEHSFLTKKEKQALKERALKGVDARLWNEFNDLLIASIVQTKKGHRQSREALDGEIDRFTIAYEKEKSIIDNALRAALRTADEAEQERLWHEYGNTIRDLQTRLLLNVRETSTTVLRDVILATVPVSGNE